jgi:hypothetical protein
VRSEASSRAAHQLRHRAARRLLFQPLPSGDHPVKTLHEQLRGHFLEDDTTNAKLQAFDELIFVNLRSQQNDAGGVRS